MKSSSASPPHTIIRASAGSGKTFQLTNRYLGLLARGVPPERILAVTFTRKAAGEIFDRIVLRLAEAATDAKKRAELATFTECDLSEKKCRDLLVSVVRSLHRLRVSTLDSFFNKLASTCSLELGLPLGWNIADELVDARLRDRAIAACLAGTSPGPILTLLNMLSRGESTRGISRLIRDTVEQLYEVARGTPAEVWKQIPIPKPPSPNELSAACERLSLLTSSHKKVLEEIEKDCACVARGAFEELLMRGIGKCVASGESTYYRTPIEADAQAVYGTLVQQAKHLCLAALAQQTQATYELLALFGKYYEQAKLQRGVLRFDDITHTLATRAMAGDARAAFRLDATIDHLLLDEFQDTSLEQWSVLRPLASRVTSHKGGSFFCVGDTKQAIYGWRGGLAELFDAVGRELPGVCEAPLNKSFRSSPVVIDVVNQVFSNLDRHTNLGDYEPAVRRWQRQFQPHETERTALAGHVTLETPPTAAATSDGREAGSTEAAPDFFTFAAGRIATAYRTYPGMSVGVLTRTNDAVAQLIYELRKLGVPASEEGGNPLTDSCAVELILSLLRLADHPGHSTAAFHLANSPLAGELGLTASEYQAVHLVSAKLRQELVETGYGRTVLRWSQLLAADCDARDRSRLQQLVELAYSYQPESTLRPADFLDLVERQRVSDPTTSPVRVMTIHQAKGLEFDVVVLTDLDGRNSLVGQSPTLVVSRDEASMQIARVCRYTVEHEQKLLPKAFQQMFADTTALKVAESLCVLYVGVTRAIHALHMLIEPIRENEKSLPKTFAGLLRGALVGDSKCTTGVLYSHGDPQWYAREAQRRKLPGVPAVEPVPAARKIALAPPQGERRRGLGRESPSRREGGAEAKARRVLELCDTKREQALLRGTVVHAWFEQVQWLESFALSDEQLLAVVDQIRGVESVDARTRNAWLKQFREMLRRDGAAEVLSERSYRASLPQPLRGLNAASTSLEVRCEWPFAVLEDGQILSGRMDRVVFLLEGGKRIAAEVIDFKTDEIGSDDKSLDKKLAHYRPQLEAYRRTIATQTGLPAQRVSAALLFVESGQLVRLAERRQKAML
jgi:ATP-dependent exoDNAse (exonuclease V) beta subunit